MDQKNFIPIGIIKVLWNFDIIDEIVDAYFEFYIPEKIEYSYGNMYCNRFIFLKDNIAYKVETLETINFNYEVLEYNENNKIYKINFNNNIIFINNEQYKLLQEKLEKINIPKKNQK